MATATMSTKGQIVIPRALREQLGWAAGTKLQVEVQGTALVLRTTPAVEPTTVDDLLGCLPYDGPAKTIEEMDEGVAAGARASDASR